jgi:hypothetical protein
MGIGFEMTLVALRLAGRRDIANEAIASKVIALTEAGERDPERLCDGVLKDFQVRAPHGSVRYQSRLKSHCADRKATETWSPPRH